MQGVGFKVFKLQKSNFPRVDFAPDPEKTEAENVELLKTYIANKEAQLVNAFNKSELLTEILLKNGYNLNYKLGLQTQFASNEVQLASDDKKVTFTTKSKANEAIELLSKFDITATVEQVKKEINIED